MKSKIDVLVIGGGPAGLAAAYEAGRRGMNTVIVEESWSLGGQLRQQTQVLEKLPSPFGKLKGIELAQVLVDRLQALPVEVLLEHRVTGVYGDGSVGVSDGEKVFPLPVGALVIATGAAEEAIAFPGWTLPGVMTAGAAQILLNREKICPGRHGLIVGSGSFALEVARQLADAGVMIRGIVEPGSRVVCQDDWCRDFIHRRRIPVYLHTFIREIRGKGQVERALLTTGEAAGSLPLELPLELEVDLICTAGRRYPVLETVEMFNCRLDYDEKLRGWLPGHNSELETSARGVFVAGGGTGIVAQGSQGAVLLSGSIAGISAVEHVRGVKTEETKEVKEQLWRQLNQLEQSLCRDEHRDGKSRLEKQVLLQMEPEAFVCRCEEITVAEVVGAINQGANTFDDIKRLTRCGMGRCQAKTCSKPVAQILATQTGLDPDQFPTPRVRMPLRPLPLGVLANSHQPSGQKPSGVLKSLLSEADLTAKELLPERLMGTNLPPEDLTLGEPAIGALAGAKIGQFREYETAIIGGGAIGSSIAFHLTESGHRGEEIILLDKGYPLSGASGSNQAWIWVHTKTPSWYGELSYYSAELYTYLGRKLGDIEYRRTGGLAPFFAAADKELARRLVETQAEAGIDIQVLDRDETLTREPILSKAVVGATYCQLDGRVNPMRLVEMYLKAARKKGVQCQFYSPVTGLAKKSGLFVITTLQGTVKAKNLVLAAGHWSRELGNLLGIRLPVRPVRGQVLVTEPIAPLLNHTLSIMGQTDNGEILIGYSKEEAGDNRATTLDVLQETAGLAVKYVPCLARADIVRSFAGLRPMPADELPILGTVPGVENLYMAVMHSGITLSPVAGTLISDLIMTGEASLPVERYSVTRFAGS